MARGLVVCVFSMNPHHFAVIMAGGAGTRFWPASRRLRPKQLLALGPNPHESMLQAVVRRLRSIIAPERIFIATGTHLVDALHGQDLGISPDNILAEPMPRNTAACIAWANAVIQRRDPNAIVAVLSADHIVLDEAAFQKSVENALVSAESGTITTLGIHPTRPETGYGYIEVGAQSSDVAFDVVRFVEKPNVENAKKMLESKRFLWNAGFFFFEAVRMSEAIGKYMPQLAQGIEKINEGARAGQESEVLRRVFPTLPSVSIDVGIMEKVEKLAVVPANFGWSDMGSWQTAWELSDKDDAGNVAPPGCVLVSSHNNLVANWSECNDTNDKVIALVGVQDLVVVQTDDALLVMPRERSQDVRRVVDALQASGKMDKL